MDFFFAEDETRGISHTSLVLLESESLLLNDFIVVLTET
jgi:hypothetical protein